LPAADCDPNKSNAYNIDRYGRYDPAYIMDGLGKALKSDPVSQVVG